MFSFYRYCITILVLSCALFSRVYCKQEHTPNQALQKVTDPAKMPYFGNMTAESAEQLTWSIQHSLTYLNRSASKLHFPQEGFTHIAVQQTFLKFYAILKQGLSGNALDEAIKQEFDVYQSSGRDKKNSVLFTGYFEPIYEGRLSPDATFRFPLYRTPNDLIRNKRGKIVGRKNKEGDIVSYWTRKEIDEGVLKGRGLEIVYLKDLFEIHMIHLQGSATILLPDQNRLRVGYAAQNLSQYFNFSLAKELKKEGKISSKELTPKGIRNYFKQCPEELAGYLHRNPSYVFFKERQGGPYGCLSVPLTAKHSLSTDKKIFPQTGLCFIDVCVLKPTAGKKMEKLLLKQFVLDQDTGGAMRGAGRCELFFGTGDEAEKQAADVYSEGLLYYLLVKEVSIHNQDEVFHDID